MKGFSLIVLFSVLLVVFTPGSLFLKSAWRSEASASCCESNCCVADTEEPKDDFNPCSGGLCNSSQSIFACFLCPLNNTPLSINFYLPHTQLTLSEVNYSLFDFTADFWNPPKVDRPAQVD